MDTPRLRPVRHLPHLLHPLEPRTLLAAFTYQPFVDALDLPRTLLDIEVPGAAVVAGLNDIDADGRPDFAVGIPGAAETPGVVRLYSAATGGLIREIAGDAPGFGSALAVLEDVDGDGVRDLAVGSPDAVDPGTPDAPGNHGLVHIYSGATGAALRTLAAPSRPAGEHAADEFGFALARLADVTADADALDEIIIGAPGAGPGDQGQVFVFSAATGDLLHAFTGEAAADRFGHAVAALGQSDFIAGDGADIVVGAPDHDAGGLAEAGKAYIYSGATGALGRTYIGGGGGPGAPGVAGERFASVIATYAAEHSALAFGAPDADPGGLTDAGRIYTIHSIDAGRDIRDGAAAGERLGGFLTRFAGGNLAFSAPGAAAGAGLTTFSPTFTPGAFSAEGAPAADLGDVNADGVQDAVLIVARPGEPARIRVASGLALLRLGNAGPASPNLEHILLPTAPGGGLLYTGGNIVRLQDLPDLADATVLSINNDGTILAQEDAGERTIFLLRSGQRTDLPITGFTAVKRGENGTILLINTADPVSPQAAAFIDGEIVPLWAGAVLDINSIGAILGRRTADGVTVLRAADGAIIELAGIQGARLADDGIVVGRDADDRIAFWYGGAVVPIGPAPVPGSSITYGIGPLGTGRRVAGTFSGAAGHASIFGSWYYDPRDGFQEPFPAAGLPLQPSHPAPESALLIAPDGRILVQTGILLPLADEATPRPAADAPIIALGDGAGDITAISYNDFGRLIAFHRPGPFSGGQTGEGGWSAITYPAGDAGEHLVGEGERIAAFVDPHTRLVGIVISGPARTVLLTLTPSAAAIGQSLTLAAGDNPAAAAPITSNLIAFTATDGRAHVAGVTAAGDWVLHYQSAPAADTWLAANLTADHLAPQGLTVPTLTGVSAYVTPWNALNIIGLDADGAAHALWWAPGLDGEGGGLWRTDNLSAAAAGGPGIVPAFAGNLTAFVTPWSAIHIVATAAPSTEHADGQVFAVWWAPGFEEAWRTDPLATPDGSPLLDPGSLTSWVTPWGGLAIAGISTTDVSGVAPGEIAVYWWSPSTPTHDNPSGWRLASLHDETSTTISTTPATRGPLSAITSATGVQHLFTRDALTGNLIAFNWTFATNWTYADLTSAAI